MLPSHYDPAKESELYAGWENSQLFQPRPSGQPDQPAFCIIMPPPNANGSLHLGHALEATIQDIFTRFHRMRGDETLWLPGADHAGILTQVVYERELAKQGKDRLALGREKFVDEVYRFTLKNRERMEQQLRRLGASCDWSRRAFTLEPRFDAPIATTFKRLFDSGFMYRGQRLINWCPRCQTALSDLEVKHTEKPAALWYIHYHAADSHDHLTVATTRPETMLGDTAVAVHPNDKRWRSFIGRTVKVPLVNRPVPVIGDETVDPKFGTGAVKVTPAHDPADFALGARHKLPALQVIGFDERITDAGKPYQGLTILEARKRILADLTAAGQLVKQESLTHSVGHCERCASVIEPQISRQWFVATKTLAQKAGAAAASGAVAITPKRFVKVFLKWLNEIEDWCVSRQLWWGHQLPVWYCGSAPLSDLQKILNRLPETPGCGQTIVAIEPPARCPACGNARLIRDPDTLDTWFSSGQWPFNALGWEPGKTHDQAPDFKRFYPTTLMNPGYEILFFWVARMLMLGLFMTGQAPFRNVFLHGILRDAKGQKMSKSKGNAVDPLKIVDEYGADSLRFALMSGTDPATDVKFNPKNAEAGRNFVTKLWNIGRFIEGHPAPGGDAPAEESTIDQWLENRTAETIKVVTKNLENLRPSRALDALTDFVWHDFADWYLELAKFRKNDPAVKPRLTETFQIILRMAHPFLPFVTETLWKTFRPDDQPALIAAPWPSAPRKINGAASTAFETLRFLVTAGRNLKVIAGLPAAAKPTFNALINEPKLLAPLAPAMAFLMGASELKIVDKKSGLAAGVRSVGAFGTLVLTAAPKILNDIKQRLTSEDQELTRRLKAKQALLKQKNFIAKAPAGVVEGIRRDVVELERLIAELHGYFKGY